MVKILEIGKASSKISQHSAEIGVKGQQQGWKLFVHTVKHSDTVPLTAAELEKNVKNIRERFQCMSFFNSILGNKKQEESLDKKTKE